MKTKQILPVVLITLLMLRFGAVILCGAAPYTATITSLHANTNNPGWLNLTAQVPSNAVVSLETARSLPARSWSVVGLPVLAPSSGLVPFTVPAPGPDQPQAFFRVKAEPFEIKLDDDGRQITLETANSVPLGALFDALKLGRDIGIYPADDADLFAPVPRLSASGANAEELLRRAGIAAWVTPTAADDPRESSRLWGNTNLQFNPLPIPPEQRGTNRMEDGYAGNPTLPTPPLGPTNAPLPGSSSAKPFNPTLGPDTSAAPQRERNPLPGPDRHIRIMVNLSAQGGANAVAAVQASDNALLDHWPSDLDEGGLIYVVRSPLAATAPGRVYFIGSRANPFESRVYGAPDGTPHGALARNGASLRLPIPVLPTDTSLVGLTVEFYSVTRSLSGVTLTAGEFLRRTAHLRLLGTVTGSQINALLAAPRFAWGGALPASTITPVHLSGSRAKKYNIAIIAEGYANTGADQTAFNDYVSNQILGELFKRDIHPSILNAVNIYRINTFSQDSGVTQSDPDSGEVTTERNTALSLRYNGSWGSMWFDIPNATEDALLAIWEDLLPEMDLCAVVANEPEGGGVAGGSTDPSLDYLIVTSGAGWDTFAHEMGHAIGSLGDEYYCFSQSASCQDYAGDEPGAANQTAETSPSMIKWKNWIPPWRPLPTASDAVEDWFQDVGLFPGATRGGNKYGDGLYRPTMNNRMCDTASAAFNPVGYTRMREVLRPYQEADLRKNVSGDFDGDGKADVVVLDDRQLSLYLSRDRNVGAVDPITGTPPRPVTGVLEPVWYLTGTIGGASTWTIRSGDQLLPADFNGDGKTDLYVVNLTDWLYPYCALLRSTGTNFEVAARYTLELPGWDDLREHDEFYVADFNNDGRDDLMVFNGLDWDKPYFILLRSTGTQLAYVRRYDRFLPDVAWAMGPHEKFLLGDFNGDGRKDVATWNRVDWTKVTLQIFTSTGTDLDLAEKHFGVIAYPPFPLFNFSLRSNDKPVVLDFNGDGRDDLAVFNGVNWQTEYLVLFASSAAAKLETRRLYADTVPGWNLKPLDTFHAADVNGDGRDDLVVFNAWNWQTQFLGMLQSTGADALQGSWQDDRIGGWNLSDQDSFRPAEFRGANGWTDLFVFNKNVFGLLRSKANSYQGEAVYPYHIHNHRYQRGGLW